MGKIYFLASRKVARKVPKTTVYDVAKSFLAIAPMTHKKLQKLCYYAYSWYLTLYDEPLFENCFEAWVHGPVDPGLYNEFKRYGWQEIPKVEHPPLDGELFEFVQEVYEAYGHLDGDELEYLTHHEEPWMEARQGLQPYEPCNIPIKDDVIRSYYLKVFESEQNE